MSAIVVLPIIIPAAPALWPALVSAAAAAASAMGYAAAKTRAGVDDALEVEISVENAEAVTGEMILGEERAFVKEDVEIRFGRGTDGRAVVKVRGCGHTEEELTRIGAQFAQTLTRQYVYHRLMKKLKERNFNVVGEEVEEDGTVRLQVRTFQG